MNRTLALCLIGAIGLAENACGDSSGPGANSGTVQVFAKDNPFTMNASLAPSFDRQGSSGAASYNGSLSGEMSVAIYTHGVWVDVGSPASVSMTAQSIDSTAVSGTVTVPAGTYSKIRIVWRNAQAHLLAGSVIGGLTLNVDALVSIGGSDSLVVEKSIEPFVVEANTTAKTAIVFDLNSEMWLTQQNVQAGTCSATSVETAVTAAARVEER